MGIELIDDEEEVDVVIISIGVDVANNKNKEELDSTLSLQDLLSNVPWTVELDINHICVAYNATEDNIFTFTARSK
jgi:hypothetical protein